MPSIVHEVLVEVLTETQALSELLEAARLGVVGRLSAVDPNFSEIEPVELRGDGFFLLGHPRNPRGWLLLEVQTSIDRKKLRTIPLSLEMARSRHRSLTGDVVMVTASEKVAQYYDAHPFVFQGKLGTRRSLEIVRIDLSRLPAEKLLDPRHPELVPLAVAAHRKEPEAQAIAERALGVMVKTQGDWEGWVVDAILQMVGERVRKAVEKQMLKHGIRTPWLRKAFDEATAKGLAKGLSKGLARGLAEGKARGEAKGTAKGRVMEARSALVRVLKRRSLPLTPELRRRIRGENDLKRLERWLDAAVTANSSKEVFQDA